MTWVITVGAGENIITHGTHIPRADTYFHSTENPCSHTRNTAYRHLALVLHVGLVADDEANHLLRVGGETIHVLFQRRKNKKKKKKKKMWMRRNDNNAEKTRNGIHACRYNM